MSERSVVPSLLLGLAAVVAAPPVARGGPAPAGRLTVLADEAHLGDGRTVVPARLVIEGGRLAWVGRDAGSPPDGAVLDGRGLRAYPGLVDLRSSAGLPPRPDEEASEVNPSLSALDFVDGSDPALAEALRLGVTTVGVAPGGRAAVGGTFALIKTDDRPLASRVVLERAGLVVTLGNEPAFGNRSPRFAPPRGLHYRRPGNRMGLASELRRAFLSARRPSREDADAAILRRAMGGGWPTQLRANKEADIRTALRLADELGLEPVVVEAVEAHRCVELLAASGAGVVLGPLYEHPRTGLERGEGDDPRHATARLLHAAGVPVALASGPRDRAGRLRDWVVLAARHGLGAGDAVAAVTAIPARLARIQERIGSLSAGHDADVVLLDGDLTDPTARVRAVLVEGRLVFRTDDGPRIAPGPGVVRTSRLEPAHSFRPELAP